MVWITSLSKTYSFDPLVCLNIVKHIYLPINERFKGCFYDRALRKPDPALKSLSFLLIMLLSSVYSHTKYILLLTATVNHTTDTMVSFWAGSSWVNRASISVWTLATLGSDIYRINEWTLFRSASTTVSASKLRLCSCRWRDYLTFVNFISVPQRQNWARK